MRSIHLALLVSATLLGGVAAEAQSAQTPAPANASAEAPSDVVQGAADGILKALEANREVYRKDAAKREQLVSQYLLPHLDTEYAARGVLGQHWRTATDDQRKRFVDAFYRSMLSNYGTALVEFTANRLKVLPTPLSAGADKATVRTQIRRDSGDPVSVNYYMHLTPSGWQAYDVQIDGISYVKSFRDDFGAQIDKEGIESVITRLQSGEKPKSLKNP